MPKPSGFLSRRWALAISVALAAILRLGMAFAGKSMWGDEFFSINLAQESWAKVILGSIADVHPPLFFVFLKTAILLFGPQEWAFRSISTLAGILTVPLIYGITRRVFDEQTAFFAALAIALSPYWLQSAHEIRGYALLAFTVSVSCYVLLRYMESPRDPGRFWLYVISCALTVYVEHYAWFWLFAGWVYAFSQRKLLRAQAAATLLALPSMGLIAYQALTAEKLFSTSRVSEYWVPVVFFKKAAGIYWHFAAGYFYSMLTSQMISENLKKSPFFWVSGLTVVLFFISFLTGLIRLRKKNRSFFWLFTAIAVFPALFLLLVYPIRLDARYLSFAAPFIFVLTVAGWAAFRISWIKISTAALFLTVSLHGSFFMLRLPTDVIHRDDFIGMTKYVFSRASDQDIVSGMETMVHYYEKKGVFTRKARFYSTYSDLSDKELRGARYVWHLDPLNMHPSVAKVNYDAVVDYMAPYGFEPAQEPLRFGGDQGLLVAYLFKRKTAI